MDLGFADSLSVNLTLDSDILGLLENDAIACDVVQSSEERYIGSILLNSFCSLNSNAAVSVNQSSLKSFKRNLSLSESQINKNKVTKSFMSTTVHSSQPDMGAILSDLNLMPQIPDSLQCAMCDYKASKKSSLKTHYQLKHLGGGGLAMNCTICQQKFSTKSNLKRHMVKAHNLTLEQAAIIIA